MATNFIFASGSIDPFKLECNERRYYVIQKIAESDKDIIEGWYSEATETATPEDAACFADKLMTEYEHDYGTIVHALVAGAIAMITSMDRHKQGGISGFQANGVMWEFMNHWMFLGENKPLHLVDYSGMLYPQYEDQFQKVIGKEVQSWLITEARSKLTGDMSLSPDVRAHMEKIVAGEVPFGYRIKGH